MSAAGIPDRGRVEGQRRKDAALDLLAARREQYVRRGRRALLHALLAGSTATADDVRQVVDLPPGINPKCFGSVPGPLARAGIIARDGFAQTCRPIGHARPVTVWRLLDRRQAVQWLIDHPERPDGPLDNGQAGLCPAVPRPLNDPSAAAATVALGN